METHDGMLLRLKMVKTGEHARTTLEVSATQSLKRRKKQNFKGVPNGRDKQTR
jgi:hypothetical protein